jgi:hypothetical protein
MRRHASTVFEILLFFSQIQHLESYLYLKMEGVRARVQEVYGTSYSHQEMHNWLQRNGFSYQKPQGASAHADPETQAVFIPAYEDLQRTLPEDEPFLFGDSVQPTMATKVTGSWIPRGKEHPILTTGSRTRLNIVVSLNLDRLDMITREFEAICQHLEAVRARYPKAPGSALPLPSSTESMTPSRQSRRLT